MGTAKDNQKDNQILCEISEVELKRIFLLSLILEFVFSLWVYRKSLTYMSLSD